MASPYSVGTLLASNTADLGYSFDSRTAVLCDGSILVVGTTASATVRLWQITNPTSTTPTVTQLTQSLTLTSATTIPTDIKVSNNGTTTSDVWVCFTSNGGGGTAVDVAHATYTASGSAWSWDNTGTSVGTLTTVNNGVSTITWDGTNLIVVYRNDSAGSYSEMLTYTTVKAGNSGWSTAAALSSTAGSGSHCFPILLHDSHLLGGSAGGTICIYSIDSNSSTHSDTFACRVLPDTAATPAVANWGAQVTISGISAQNIGAGSISGCVDPATGQVHLVYASSVVGTGGVVGISYIPITVNSSGVPSFGSRVTVDTTSGSGSVDCCVDVNSLLYVFYSTGAIGSAGTIKYRTASSPFTTFSAAASTVAAAAGDGYPHTPNRDYVNSGYIPLFFQRGSSTITALFDNTIAAGTSVPSPVNGTGGGTASQATASGTGTFTLPSRTGSGGGTAPQATASGSGTAPTPGYHGSGGGTAKNPTASGTGTRGLPSYTGSGSGVAQHAQASGTGTNPLPASSGLVVSTQTQSGISGGPGGNNTTETDVTYTDGSGNGTRVGMIPGYGGAVISPWEEVRSGSVGISQTSLATSTPDGLIHVLAQSTGAVYTGTEDAPYSLAEIAPTGTNVRRYYDSGTMSPSGGPALQYRVRTLIQPGDPFLLFHRIDIINPSSTTAVSLASSDSLEIAMIGGLIQSLQGGVNAWQPANGKYATVGGAESTWPSALTTANPDYIYINPQSGSGLITSPFAIKKTGLVEAAGVTSGQVQYLQNTSRLKMKLQGSKTSVPANTTYTLYYAQGFRKSLAAGEVNAIAADYLNPDSFTGISGGSYTSYSYDEGANVLASTSGTSIQFSHTFTAPVTKRWNPFYKITNWTASTAPVSKGGTALTSGTDYLSYVDTTNHVAYVKLLAPVQSTDGAILVGTLPTFTGSGAGVAGHATASGAGTFTPPSYTGSGTGRAKNSTASGTGTFGVPAYTGSGSGRAKNPTASGTGTRGVPSYTGSGTARSKNPTASGTGTSSAPARTGTGHAVAPAPRATGSGTGTSGSIGHHGPTAVIVSQITNAETLQGSGQTGASINPSVSGHVTTKVASAATVSGSKINGVTVSTEPQLGIVTVKVASDQIVQDKTNTGATLE